MAQFWEFGSSFSDYFNIDHSGSSKGESDSESGSKKDVYLVKNEHRCACRCVIVH